MKRLYYLGKPRDGTGWGVCNTNLVRALSKFCDVVVPPDDRNRFDAPVLAPSGLHSLAVGRPVKCPRLMIYGFWEWPIIDPAAQFNADKCYAIFGGSSWCAERVRQYVKHPRVLPLVQGVDCERFHPVERPKERNGFRVFSGGKYEFRKGQDIVLAAMKVFMAQRTDALLLCSWYNPWPASAKTMEQSYLINAASPFNGIDEKRVFKLPPVENARMPEVFSQCDVAFFPNRCEGGTNLVMMEAMASGLPVIATNATGHRDILAGAGQLDITQGSYDEAGWFNADVSDCLYQLERAYQNRDKLARVGLRAHASVEPWTWERAAREVVRVAFE